MRNAALQPCVCLGTLALAVLCFPDAIESVMESDRFPAPVLAAGGAPELEAVTITPDSPALKEGADVRTTELDQLPSVTLPNAATGEHFEPLGVRVPDVPPHAGARGL